MSEDILKELQKAAGRRDNGFEFILSQHLLSAVSQYDKLDKILLVLEGSMLTKLKVNEAIAVKNYYAVATALKSAKSNAVFISISWPFPATAENYQTYIAPWHQVPITFNSQSQLDDDKAQRMLNGKEEWDRFFIITTKLGLDPASLAVLKSEFISHMMEPITSIYGSVSEQVPLSIYLKRKREEAEEAATSE